ncbi:MAG: Brix domain-containing protein [Candidatus Methanofastidiosia archaeon]
MLITTSRRTSQRTRTFCRELASVFPFCEYVTRGKKSIKEVTDYAFRKGHSVVMLVESRDGNPSRLSLVAAGSSLEWLDFFRIGVKTRKDMNIKWRVPPLSEGVSVGIKSNLSPTVNERIMRAFEVCEEDSFVKVWLREAENGFRIDFLREDVSNEPVGPQIRVFLDEDENRVSG